MQASWLKASRTRKQTKTSLLHPWKPPKSYPWKPRKTSKSYPRKVAIHNPFLKPTPPWAWASVDDLLAVDAYDVDVDVDDDVSGDDDDDVQAFDAIVAQVMVLHGVGCLQRGDTGAPQIGPTITITQSLPSPSPNHQHYHHHHHHHCNHHHHHPHNFGHMFGGLEVWKIWRPRELIILCKTVFQQISSTSWTGGGMRKTVFQQAVKLFCKRCVSYNSREFTWFSWSAVTSCKHQRRIQRSIGMRRRRRRRRGQR